MRRLCSHSVDLHLAFSLASGTTSILQACAPLIPREKNGELGWDAHSTTPLLTELVAMRLSSSIPPSLVLARISSSRPRQNTFLVCL